MLRVNVSSKDKVCAGLRERCLDSCAVLQIEDLESEEAGLRFLAEVQRMMQAYDLGRGPVLTQAFADFVQRLCGYCATR